MDGLEDDDGNALPARRWSPFIHTDCVALKAGKVVNGKAEFSTEYASQVFIFETEANMKKFLDKPREFIHMKP